MEQWQTSFDTSSATQHPSLYEKQSNVLQTTPARLAQLPQHNDKCSTGTEQQQMGQEALCDNSNGKAL